MLYLYAITERTANPLPAGKGIGGFPLFTLEVGDLQAVMSECTAKEPEQVEENLWLHENIVESLMADRSVLPVRFGTLVVDEAQMRLRLTTYHDRFAAALAKVRGRVELGLRVVWNEDKNGVEESPLPSPEAETSAAVSAGRAYLVARLEKERRAQAARARGEDLAVRLRAALAGLTIDNVIRVSAGPRLTLTAAYLVDRQKIDDFQAAVQSLTESMPDVQMMCTGPWPAYSFVTGCVPQSATDSGAVLAKLLQES